MEINGLPLKEQQREIERKRRHGMGYLGLGSAITMLGMAYGDHDSIEFTEQVTKEMAVVGWRAALELSEEKGPAPIMEEDFTITAKMLRTRPEMARDGLQVGDVVKGKVLHARYSRYMQQLSEIEPDLVKALEEKGGVSPTTVLSHRREPLAFL